MSFPVLGPSRGKLEFGSHRPSKESACRSSQMFGFSWMESCGISIASGSCALLRLGLWGMMGRGVGDRTGRPESETVVATVGTKNK